jgi:hypothetical protein
MRWSPPVTRIDPVGFREAQHEHWDSAAAGWKAWSAFKRLHVPAPPAGTPGPLSRPTPAAIGGLLAEGGFSQVAVEQAEVTFAFDSPEHFTAYVRAISAPVRAMIEQHAGEAQEAAWDAITQAAADAAGGSKPLSFSNVALLASATSPGR